MADIHRTKHLENTGLGVGGEPRKGAPKTEEERRLSHEARFGKEEPPERGTGLSQDLILQDARTGDIKTGGIVVDEERALETPCHGYRVSIDGEVSELVWSPGIIGALSEEEKGKYCKLGIQWKPAPEGLERRWTALRKAGVKFPKRR